MEEYFKKVSFTEIYEIENWKEDQIEKYVKNYLGFCKKEYLYHEIFEKQNCESFGKSVSMFYVITLNCIFEKRTDR